jgi:hypothetical protein
MALNKNALAAAIKTTFETAKVKSEDPSLTPEQILQQVADSLAAAIDTFVRGGDVIGVKSTLKLDVPTNSGTGSQTGAVHIQ